MANLSFFDALNGPDRFQTRYLSRTPSAWSSVTCGDRVHAQYCKERRSGMKSVRIIVLVTVGLALYANPGLARERGFSAYDRIEHTESRGRGDEPARGRDSQGVKQSSPAASHSKKTRRVSCGHLSKRGCRDPFTARRPRARRPRKQDERSTTFQPPRSQVQVHGVVVR